MLVINQYNCQLNKLIGITSDGEMLIVNKNGDKRLPLLVNSFEKEVNSHSNNKRLQLKPFIMHLKAHKVLQQECFFLSLFSCNRRPIQPKCVQDCYVLHVGIHIKWEYWYLKITERDQCLSRWGLKHNSRHSAATQASIHTAD